MTRPLLVVRSIPPGEAPLWVRECWIGLRLPLAQRDASQRSYLTAGVLSGPRNLFSWLHTLLTSGFVRQSGYIVNALEAVELLEATSPDAANWWRKNVPHMLDGRQVFVFGGEVGDVLQPELAGHLERTHQIGFTGTNGLLQSS